MKKSQRLKSCALIFNRKVKLVMKLATVLLVVFQLSVSATALSQARVSLNLKNATIEEFINSMKEQTGRQFLYNASLMKSEERVNVEANDEDFFVLLDRILPSFHLTYDIVNDVVVLKLLPQALPGVTVRIKGTTIGTATNGAGSFSLNIPHATDTLVISFVGMKTKEIIVKKAEKKEYEIILEDDVETLEEVNVISTGYQDIDRRKLTSAVTSLKMEDVNVAGLSSVDKMLEGHIPGMIFMQNSGQAGAAPKIRIRGTSTVLGNQEPLWVVDGIVQTDPVNWTS